MTRVLLAVLCLVGCGNVQHWEFDTGDVLDVRVSTSNHDVRTFEIGNIQQLPTCRFSRDCPIGSFCTEGQCGPDEVTERNFPVFAPVVCDGNWINPNIDRDHCGQCNTPCNIRNSCQQGICESCSPIYGFNWQSCGNGCVDLSYDSLNCGGCGIRCSSTLICFEGTCL